MAEDLRWKLNNAIKRQNVVLVKSLLVHGANVNSRVDGSTPLHIACDLGHAEMVDILLVHGAKVNAKRGGFIGGSPLHAALRGPVGNLDIVALLLDGGADLDGIDDFGSTPLMCACHFINNGIEVIRELLYWGASVDGVNADTIPLFVACAYGKREIAMELLDHGANVHITMADSVASSTEYDSFWSQIAPPIYPGRLTTALHMACYGNHTDIVKELLKQGANINACDCIQRTPLHGSQSLHGVKLLLEHGSNINVELASILTPFRGESQLVDILLQRSVKLNLNACDKYGWTPLHLASLRGCEEAVHLLLKCGANIDSRSNENQTPLHLACQYINCSTVERLLKSGATVDVIDKTGKTPVQYAIKKRFYKIVELFVEHYMQRPRKKLQRSLSDSYLQSQRPGKE